MNQEKENNKEALDLKGAFKDSGVKLQGEGRRYERSYFPGTPKIIQWVIKYSGGLIKNEKQAFYVILGFIVFALVISLYLVLGGSGTPESIEGTEYTPYEGYGGKELPDEFR